MANNRLFPLIWYSLICLALFLGWPGNATAQDNSLSNVIEWPNEGETLYAGPSSLLYKVPIKGRVNSATFSAAEITVELIIFKDENPIGSLTSTPDEDGYYELFVTVNPDGQTEQFEIAFIDCGVACHSPAEVDLLPGKLRLQVTATDPDGRQATAERNITVDIAEFATVPVQVSLVGDDNQPVSDVNILASTWIYLWRSRFASDRSDATGLAEVHVEALSQSPTEYVFKVDPTIIDGVLYEGVGSAEVILAPGAKSHPPIELTVTARQGLITGMLSSPKDISVAGLPVWAIHPPAGSSVQTTTSANGEFEFSEVPLDQYLITLNNKELLREGLEGAAEEIDLSRVIEAELDISLNHKEGNILSGRISDESGNPLPFAWTMVEGINDWQAIMPGFDGQFTMAGLPSSAAKVVVTAPGYYGRVMALEGTPLERLDISLNRQEETSTRPWGLGEIIIPSNTHLQEHNGSLFLDRGWIWGQSSDGDPVTFQLDSNKITIFEGDFAIEYLPGQSAWLYLMEGKAEVGGSNVGPQIAIESGQMINLLNDQGPEAVPLDPVVIDALESYRKVDVPLVWQPTLGAQIRDRIAWIGVGTAQVVTFVTYFVLILSLILLPLLGIYWWWRRRNENKPPD